MPPPLHPDIERARAQALIARARLAGTMSEIQQRLAPKALIRGAWDEVRERGTALAQEATAQARQQPAATAGVALLAGLILARKPLLRRFWRNKETAPSADSSQSSKPGPRRRRRASEETGP